MSFYIARDELWLIPEARSALEAHPAMPAGAKLQKHQRPDFPVRGSRRVVAQL